PVVRPGIQNANLTVATGGRGRFWSSLNGVLQKRDFGHWMRLLSVQLNCKAWAALTLSATPSVMRVRSVAQYLATVTDPTATQTFGARYVFGNLGQTEVAMPLRANLVLSPKLSLQLYTQGLLSTGNYRAIEELAAPRTYDFPAYGRDVGTLAYDPAGASYLIDPDGAGQAASFRIA